MATAVSPTAQIHLERLIKEAEIRLLAAREGNEQAALGALMDAEAAEGKDGFLSTQQQMTGNPKFREILDYMQAVEVGARESALEASRKEEECKYASFPSIHPLGSNSRKIIT